MSHGFCRAKWAKRSAYAGDVRCPTGVNNEMLKALKGSGWGSGFTLPFANEENQELERQLELKQKKVLTLTSILEDDTNHLIELQKHFKRVEFDLAVTHNLLAAKQGQISSTKGADSFNARIFQKFLEEKNVSEAAWREYRQRNSERLKFLEERKKVVEKLLATTQVDAQVLAKWTEKTGKTDQEIKDIHIFQNLDGSQERELQAKQADLGAKNRELRNTLESLTMSTVKLQEQFSRTSVEFRKAHRARKDLVTSWQRSVDAMKHRDAEMAELGEEYYKTREQLCNLQIQLIDREKLLKEALNSGCEVKHQSNQAEKRKQNAQTKLGAMQQEHIHLRDEETASRQQLEGVSAHLRRLEIDLRRVEEEHQRLWKRDARLTAEIIVLEARLEQLKNESQSEESCLAKLTEDLRKNEERCGEIFAQLKSFRQFIWERHADKQDIEHELQAMDRRIVKVQSLMGFYNNQDMKNDLLMNQLNTTLFHTELRASQLEARISKLREDCHTVEHLERQKKITELKELHKSTTHGRVFMQKHLEHDTLSLGRIERTIEKARQDIITLSKHCETVHLECEGLEKQVKAAGQQIRDEVVTLSLQKVFLKKLKDDHADTHTRICSLSHHRFSIEGAVKERKSEIDIHISTSLLLLKSTKEENSKIKGFILEVEKLIMAKKQKFAIVSNMMDVSTPEAAYASFTDRIVGVIRERESLSSERQNWAMRVEEAEKELNGLSNTAQILKASNCAFKTSLAPAEPNSKEFERAKEMEAAEKLALMRRHRAKKARMKLAADEEDLTTAINVLKQHIRSVSFVCNAKMRLASMLTNELLVQRDKISRWSALTLKLLLELKGLVPPERLKSIECDLKYRFLREKLEFAVVMLEKLVLVFPGVKNTVLYYLDRCDLLLPIQNRIKNVCQGFRLTSRHARHFTDTYSDLMKEVTGRTFMSESDIKSAEARDRRSKSRPNLFSRRRSKSPNKLPAIS